VTDGAETAQAAGIRLRFSVGEWFLDRIAGLDIFGKILNISSGLREKELLLRGTILATPGVRQITRFEIAIDREAHALRVDFDADTEWDQETVEVVIS